ncbi:hypothetical protein [Trueperella bialowiezensis]|uniref:Uncharacterized protein n=1 Tax=Trueperella bialowiezensis TaxID=312285 RepID=A0A3S4V5W5_9ACTO|nr:hypothetical protein [Trueperella bialowiezensis]VEI12764.1 Uncharacterised protein [Trueperella bialowiezensis]
MEQQLGKRVRIFVGTALVFVGIFLIGPTSRGATLGGAFAENWMYMIGMAIVALAIAMFVPLSDRRRNDSDDDEH